MACYSYSVSVCSGKKGGSAVASAAYQSGQTLPDKADGKIKDYDRKERVLDTNIILPDNAPEWMSDRSKLWSAVELKEGPAGQYARKHIIALPCELSKKQLKELAQQIARDFVDQGMVADYAIHYDPHNVKNIHMHLMTTMRPIAKNGDWGAKSKNVTLRDKSGKPIKAGRDKNGKIRYKHKCVKTTDWDDHRSIERWRYNIEYRVNQAYATAGIDARVSAASYQTLGIDRIPTKHLGYKNAEQERRGVRTRNGDYNRRVRARNARVAQNEQKITDIAHSIDHINAQISINSINKEAEQNARAIRRRRKKRGPVFARTHTSPFVLQHLQKRTNANYNRSATNPILLHQGDGHQLGERRRVSDFDALQNASERLTLINWHNLTRDERRDALAKLNNIPIWRNATDVQKARFGHQSMFVTSSDRRAVALYPLSRDNSKHEPGDKITTEDMYNDCRSAAGGLREAGQALKAAADSITSALDPKKSSWQHIKAATKDARAVVATPVVIARDILSNPITGLLKAPIRAMAAGAKTTSAVINAASVIGKGGDGGRARARDRQSSR